jgi:hypothetical protein
MSTLREYTKKIWQKQYSLFILIRIKNVKRKNNCIINIGDNPTKEER